MDTIRLGVIGCGDIAFRSYLPALRDIGDEVRLTAVCDVNPARVEQARAEYGAEHGYGDAQEMLAGAPVDGVLVLTPMVPHGPLCIAALEAGKHVYVEKVMAVELAQADQMIALAERQGLTLACAPSTILLSAFQRAKDWVSEGQIGRVSLVNAIGAHHGPARWDDYTSDPSWFYQPGAGPLFDLAVYPVQILTHIFGPVKRVTAFSGLACPEVVMTPQPVRGQTLRVETDDTIPFILDFGNATFASVITSYNVLFARLPAMQFFGDQGSLTAPQFLGDEVAIRRRGEADWTVEHLPPTRYDRLGVAAGLPHWLDCVRSGGSPVNHARHARHVLDVLLACQESARTGRAVAVHSAF